MGKPSAGSRPRIWTVLIAVPLLLLLQAALGAPIGVIALAGNVALISDPEKVQAAIATPQAMTAILATAGLASLLVVVSAVILSPQPWRRRLSLERLRVPPTDVILLLVAGISLGAITNPLAKALGRYDESSLQRFHEVAVAARPSMVVALAIAAGCAGACEEVLFRGYAQTRLVQRLGGRAGIVLTAILFGAVHLDVVQGAFAALYGAVLGAVAFQRRSIALGVIAHLLNNVVSFALSKLLPHANSDEVEGLPLTVLVATALFCGCAWLLHRRGKPVAAVMLVEAGEQPAPVAPSAMSRRVLALVGVWMLAAMLIVAAFVIALVIVVTGNLKAGRDPASKVAREQGHAFGLDHDERACIDEALGQVGTDASSRKAASAFAMSCLRYASPSLGFCDDGPPIDDWAGMNAWIGQECVALGRPGDQACSGALIAMALHCRHAGKE